MRLGIVMVVAVGCGGSARAPAPSERCLDDAAIARRETALAAARATNLDDVLAADGLRVIELELAWSRVDRAQDAGGGDPLVDAWTEVAHDGARWIAGARQDVDCELQVRTPNERFAVARDGAIVRLEVTHHATTRTMVRRCGTCPSLGSTCGAHLPQTVQPRWKLPAATRWAGDKAVRVDAPALEVLTDPPPAACRPPEPPP